MHLSAVPGVQAESRWSCPTGVSGDPLIKGNLCKVGTKDGAVPWASTGAMLLPLLGPRRPGREDFSELERLCPKCWHLAWLRGAGAAQGHCTQRWRESGRGGARGRY